MRTEEQRRAQRKKKRQEGICIWCTKETVFNPKMGCHDVRCPECIYQHREKSKHYYNRNRQARIEKNQQYKVNYRKEGRCTDCSNKLMPEDNVLCCNCKERKRAAR